MKKNLAILLLICLTAITSWAGSTNEAVESLNRKLPLGSNADRLLSKMIYDEVNNIVVANYYTSWQNLVQMRKAPDFSKRAGDEVLENIFIEDANVKPFTLIVNYFADEAGFEDLAKTFFITPGQVGSAQKAFQKNNKKNSRNNQKEQFPTPTDAAQSSASSSPTQEQLLQGLEAKLAEFKGFTDPQGRFSIARYALSKDKKNINIIVMATPEAIPFFTDEQYAPLMESSMSERLRHQYSEFEDIFNTMDLDIAIYTADSNGQLKGEYKFPASKVFTSRVEDTSAQDNDKDKVTDKDKKKDKDKSKKNKDKDKSKSENTAPEALVELVTPDTTPTLTTNQGQSQQPSQTSSTESTAATQATQGDSTKKNTSPEEAFQALVKLYQALLPQKLDDGLKLTHIKSNQEAVVLFIDADGEKFTEASMPQIREMLVRHLAAEFGKKKSVFPLLLNLSCQTSRKLIYMVGSKGWSETYPVPLDPCSVINSLKSKIK